VTITRQQCPACQNDCKLILDFDQADYVWLDDRLLGLSEITCRVECVSCGRVRMAKITDLDVSWETNRIEHGTITYD
jgi:hypothetical protein